MRLNCPFTPHHSHGAALELGIPLGCVWMLRGCVGPGQGSELGGALETTSSGKTEGKTTGAGWEPDLFCSWLGCFGLEQVWSILQCLGVSVSLGSSFIDELHPKSGQERLRKGDFGTKKGVSAA